MQVPAGGKGGKMDQAPLRPPWVVVLNYEYELRKEAIKRAYRDSRPLRETLREVTEDAQIKEQYFTSPIALQNRGKRASDSWEPWDDGNYNKWNRNSWKGGWQHKGDNDKGLLMVVSFALPTLDLGVMATVGWFIAVRLITYARTANLAAGQIPSVLEDTSCGATWAVHLCAYGADVGRQGSDWATSSALPSAFAEELANMRRILLTWSAGISEKRATWIIEWINQAEQAQWMVTGRQLTEFIGRLNFVTRLLAWLKPFLAPLFAWSAALNRSTAATAPEMVIQFMNGARLDTVHMSWPSCDRQAFRTDAKCETGRVVLGGWSLEHGLNTQQASWFALEISPTELPALFKEGHSSEWASTTAELLASYAGLVAFGHLVPAGGRDSLRLQVHAGTDNSATPAVLSKGISNKWPVQGLHMQMAVSLRKANKVCRLTWRPREENQDADDLTNLRFENFDHSLRVPLKLSDIPLELFHMLHQSHADFVAEKDRLLSLKRVEPKTSKRQKLLDKTSW
ncbi:unnamed protein product [Symbiodinium necroappetens]|uniref:Uncharacterized protein n=1 Tax=Symbiodinium necroappetens TaxID=1628268 RepID=A0A813AYC1_9DINO|nr:unnamed protein product [Symbiodinium necroappetens]